MAKSVLERARGPCSNINEFDSAKCSRRRHSRGHGTTRSKLKRVYQAGGGGGKNRKPKGWEKVFGCMMKHSSDVLPVVSSTQHSQPSINLLALEQKESKKHSRSQIVGNEKSKHV